MSHRSRLVSAGLAAALALAPSSSRAGIVRQLTDVKTTIAGPGAMDTAGSVVFSGASADLGGNPQHTLQILQIDPVSAAASALTSARKGTTALVAASGDGRYLAFPSPADLVGTNHDESVELFVLDRTANTFTQLTSDPAPNAGSVSAVAISGDGSRIAFLSDCDYLGTNPSHLEQLFTIRRDGTQLRQLTFLPAPASFGSPSISDDGSRIAFACDGNPAGGNADGGDEVFAILSDGTGLRQVTTSPATYGSSAPSLSGNGAKIAFQSNADLTGGNVKHQTEVFVVDWAGTNLRQLTSTSVVLGITGAPVAESPSITGDGLTVVFSSNNSRLFPPLNIDGNNEIWKIKTDGTGLTALTSTALTYGALLPAVARGGTRITYYNVGSSVTLEAMDGSGGSKKTLLTFDITLQGQQDVAADGSRVVFVRTVGLLGSGQVWRVAADGSDLAQVTALTSGSAAGPQIAADAATIVFSANSDPLGTNADGSEEIFTTQASGSGLKQLTSGASGTTSHHPAISADGKWVVFDSNANLTGGNADGSTEIFRVGIDGMGLVQLTSGPAGTTSDVPRVDGTGVWAVFESNADLDGGNPDGSYEVWRVRLDGTVLERLTGDPAADSGGPDISDAGDRIVFSSSANLGGGNADGNAEVFEYEPATAALRQLTSFVKGSSGSARISGNGAWVYFASSAPVFEDDPDAPTDLYRVPAAGGAIERVGGLRSAGVGATGAIGGALGAAGGGGVAVGLAGDVAAFSGLGDYTGGNKDALPEIWLIDRSATASVDVSKASPTVLSWTVESGPVRYDVIRGDLSQVHGLAGSIDLGTVRCLEAGSPDADTVGFGDATDPAPGQVFFFLYRGSQGLGAGPGSYGASTDGRERLPSSGGC